MILVQQGTNPQLFFFTNATPSGAYAVAKQGLAFTTGGGVIVNWGANGWVVELVVGDTPVLGPSSILIYEAISGVFIVQIDILVVSFDPTGSNYGTGTTPDPWLTPLPGAYGAGTAGEILGTNLDALISTRSTYAGGPVASVTGDVGGNLVGNVLGTLPEVVLAASQPHWSLGATLPRGVALAGLQFEMYGLTSPSEPLTGLTVSGAISKDGGAFAPCTNAPVPLTNGTYAIDLTAAELTCKVGKLRLTAAGADTTYISLLTSS